MAIKEILALAITIEAMRTHCARWRPHFRCSAPLTR